MLVMQVSVASQLKKKFLLVMLADQTVACHSLQRYCITCGRSLSVVRELITLLLCLKYRGPSRYLLVSSVPLLDLTVPQSLPCPPFTETWQGNFRLCANWQHVQSYVSVCMVMIEISLWKANVIMHVFHGNQTSNNNINSAALIIPVPCLKHVFLRPDIWSLSVSCC